MANAESISDSQPSVSSMGASRTSKSSNQKSKTACKSSKLGISESLEAQYSPSDANESISNIDYEESYQNSQSAGYVEDSLDGSVTNYAESANQTSEIAESELDENIQDVLDKIDGMNEAELEKMIDQLEAFELEDSDGSAPLSESTQRGSNDGTLRSRKKIAKDRKLNWQAKASTPAYMLSSVSRLQTVDDICRARMEAKERIEKLTQERIEATVNKAKNEKERMKKEVQEKKKAEAEARANIVAAERGRVAAAKKKQQEQTEKFKKEVADRKRQEAIDKQKMIEEVEKKRKEIAKARMEAFQAKKPIVMRPAGKEPLVQSK